MSPDQANRLAFWDRSLRQGTILLKYTSGFVKPGKITFLMGPSGAGKTTLFNCLSGKATSGTFDGWFGVNGQVRSCPRDVVGGLRGAAPSSPGVRWKGTGLRGGLRSG